VREKIGKLLSEMNVEYFTVLPYSALRESAPRIIERANISPRTVILYLLPYYGGETVNLSRYAASRDYHLIIKEINSRLSSLISEYFPGAASRGYGDHSPIDERSAALVGGLGILGDNGLLINEKYGSYVFIGELICDVEPELLAASAPGEVSYCHHCGACKTACPTGILSGKGDSCLSMITQKKGVLSEEECRLMRKYNTLWGCDECQRVCPYNREPRLTPIDFFHKDRICELDSDTLNGMDDTEFSERAFAWRGRKTLERNLEILGK
jgi:epoxyqueuosine reductase